MITLVPGHLVCSHQLVDQMERVKGVSGLPVEVQCADVPFEFEGRQFTQRVAVANKDLINDRVLFAVPLVVDQARCLFLGAVDSSNTPETKHSGDIADSQSLLAAVAATDATDSNTVVCSKLEVGELLSSTTPYQFGAARPVGGHHTTEYHSLADGAVSSPGPGPGAVHYRRAESG